MFPLQGSFHPPAEGFTAVQLEHILPFFYFGNPQKSKYPFIIGENISFCIQYQQPFLHIGCNGIKFFFSAFQFRHLPVDLSILDGNFTQKRCQFIINHCLFRMLQIDLINGIRNIFRRPKSDQRRKPTHQKQHDDQGIDRLQKQRKDALGFQRKTHHAAILKSESIIPCFFRKGIRMAFLLSAAAAKCFLHFLTVCMVFHFILFRHRVIQNSTIRCDPSHTGVIQRAYLLQIFHALHFNTGGNISRLSAQFVSLFLGGKIIHDPHDEGRNTEHYCKGYRKNRTKDTIRHTFPPTL